MLTTAQAAKRLGISARRVQALIASGRLPAEKLGRDWLIADQALDTVRQRRAGYPKGRPRKPSPTPQHAPPPVSPAARAQCPP